MFDMTDFNKRHKTASLKAQYINFNTALKLTKLQMDDRAYKVRRPNLDPLTRFSCEFRMD